MAASGEVGKALVESSLLNLSSFRGDPIGSTFSRSVRTVPVGINGGTGVGGVGGSR